ncbi:hypothetical protein Zmor_018290 [Zophobas morio]|uniref:Uncharacterized protein n=1 Tax=Zophobas morio TaxID=2755281 RepID=A0AA38MDD1_9CUCU|nr:hypothetical protein Zmor_018290 [Zophobas morio]
MARAKMACAKVSLRQVGFAPKWLAPSRPRQVGCVKSAAPNSPIPPRTDTFNAMDMYTDMTDSSSDEEIQRLEQELKHKKEQKKRKKIEALKSRQSEDSPCSSKKHTDPVSSEDTSNIQDEILGSNQQTEETTEENTHLKGEVGEQVCGETNDPLSEKRAVRPLTPTRRISSRIYIGPERPDSASFPFPKLRQSSVYHLVSEGSWRSRLSSETVRVSAAHPRGLAGPAIAAKPHGCSRVNGLL